MRAREEAELDETLRLYDAAGRPVSGRDRDPLAAGGVFEPKHAGRVAKPEVQERTAEVVGVAAHRDGFARRQARPADREHPSIALLGEPCQSRAGERKAKDREGALPGDPAEAANGAAAGGRGSNSSGSCVWNTTVATPPRSNAAAAVLTWKGNSIATSSLVTLVLAETMPAISGRRGGDASAFLLVASGSARGGAAGASAGPSASGRAAGSKPASGGGIASFGLVISTTKPSSSRKPRASKPSSSTRMRRADEPETDGFDAADCGSDLRLGAAKLEGGRGVDAHFRGLPLDLERDRHAADRLEHEPRQGGQRRDAQRHIARALLSAAKCFLAGARFGLPGAAGERVDDLGRKRRQQPGPVRRQEIDEHLLGGFENVRPPALRQRDPQSPPVGIVPDLRDVARQLTGESLALDLRRLGKGQHQHAVDGADLDLRLAVELEHDAPEAAHLDTAHRRRAGGRRTGAENEEASATASIAAARRANAGAFPRPSLPNQPMDRDPQRCREHARAPAAETAGRSRDCRSPPLMPD